MQFTRTLTADETERLGNRPIETLNGFIDQCISQIKRDVTQRVLSIMDTKTAMTARQITEAHNAVYGRTPVALSYMRFILAEMTKVQVIKRKSRGRYIK